MTISISRTKKRVHKARKKTSKRNASVGDKSVKHAESDSEAILGSFERELATVSFRDMRIRPTLYGYFFMVFLLLLLVLAINVLHNTAFILCFLLISVLHSSFWLGVRNLQALQIFPCATESVFAGQTAYFHFIVFNPSRYDRHTVAIQWQQAPISMADINAGSYVEFSVRVPTAERGVMRPGTFYLFTQFPLALFKVRYKFSFEQAIVVYPHPAIHFPAVQTKTMLNREPSYLQQGNDDFSRLREYQSGDSLKHIAWKQSSKLSTLYTKDFQGEMSDLVYSVSWEYCKHKGEEPCISTLCAQVLDISESGKPYELILPHVSIPPSHNAQHRHRCLMELALTKIEEH